MNLDYMLKFKDSIPLCNCGGIIKPDVILYNEPLVDKDYVNNLLPMLSMYVSVEAVPNCKNVEILDTKITKQPAGKDAKEWEEVWTLGACGKKVEVPLSLKDEDKRIQTFITSDKMKVLK